MEVHLGVISGCILALLYPSIYDYTILIPTGQSNDYRPVEQAES